MKQGVFPIIGNIFSSAMLRNLFLACLGAAIILPYYSTFHIMPRFYRQLIENTETEACRTAAHLSSTILTDSADFERDNFTAKNIGEINRILKDFGIAKLKVFSKNGTIVYSTSREEIGEINHHDYFRETVARGEVFSKFVEKDQKSAEGKLFKLDVAEVYVPIMEGPTFLGALEIYYDMSREKQGLDKILTHSSRLLYGLAGLLLLFAVMMLFKASEAMIRRTHVEQKLHETNRLLEKQVFEQTDEIRVTQKTSIEALATLVENYDPDTGSHLIRIQQYVELLLSQLERSSPYSRYIQGKDNYQESILLASILHDIGKVAVDREILLKPGRLTKEEFEKVKGHTLVAGELLGKANQMFVDTFGKDSYLALARDIALYHHEKWDGNGYPYGLSGEEIPLSARVVALADVYDALRSPRPYKQPQPHAFSVEEICRNRGSHFDPCVVDAFLAQAHRFDEVASSFYREEFPEHPIHSQAMPGEYPAI